MKVVERIIQYRIQQQSEIDDMQFGSVKGKEATDAIFMARQMQENFRVKGKKLYFVLIKISSKQPKSALLLTFRPLSEAFIRRSWY